MIAAVSKNSVIGKNNQLPFDRPEDMKFFRKMTAGATVIMGRRTFESMGSKPLPKRRNIVITRAKIEGVECCKTLRQAIEISSTLISLEGIGIIGIKDDHEPDNIWLIGGSNIYREGLSVADHIYLTLMPDIIEGDDLTYFPFVSPQQFQVSEYIPLISQNLKPEDCLQVAHYTRI